MLRRLGYQAIITSDPEKIGDAEKIILPGVGSFDTGMRNIRERGLEPILNKKAIEGQVPILGICLGMQLLSESSEEGKELGLGWIPGQAVRFVFTDDNERLKIPHMGWNSVTTVGNSPLFEGFLPEMRFYFVHSYHVVCRRQEDVLMTTEYGGVITAAVERGNIMGTQFHPEKSHKYGMILLKNFAEM